MSAVGPTGRVRATAWVLNRLLVGMAFLAFGLSVAFITWAVLRLRSAGMTAAEVATSPMYADPMGVLLSLILELILSPWVLVAWLAASFLIGVLAFKTMRPRRMA